MSLIRKLAGETVIYGLSSILGRMLGFLLTPLYTRTLPQEEYGSVTELFAYAGFLMVVFTYRMETAYFRYGTDKEKGKTAYSTALLSVVCSTIVLYGLILIFANPLAELLHYENHVNYITMIGMILAFDALCELPFARLRIEQKAGKFALYRIINISTNVVLNLFFLVACPWVIKHADSGVVFDIVSAIYRPDFGVGYILLSNVMASGLTMLLLLPMYRNINLVFDRQLWKTMVNYAWPLMIAGFAGMVNEMLDRTMLKWRLPGTIEENKVQLAIYGANYKLTMILTLFTQAFRYAAEPFFFRQAAENRPRTIYADVTKYYTIISCVGLLFTFLYLDIFRFILDKGDLGYWKGLVVVPVLLFANLFLGIYYNMSIWFKLSNNTYSGAVIGVMGAAVTILLNLWWIPVLGYVGSAWATFFCYLSMMVVCYYWGQRVYRIPYQVRLLSLYLFVTASILLTSYFLVNKLDSTPLRIFLNTILFGLFFMLIYYFEKDKITNIIRKNKRVSPEQPGNPD